MQLVDDVVADAAQPNKTHQGPASKTLKVQSTHALSFYSKFALAVVNDVVADAAQPNKTHQGSAESPKQVAAVKARTA
jgi:hypothetical protein